jgi:hypothetical protein
MHRLIKERYCSWKEVFWRKAVAITAACYFLLGSWDLFKSEFLPEKYQSWTVVKLTPHLSGSTWLILLLVIIIILLLEGAHTAMQKRDRLIAELQQTSGELAEHDPKVYLEPLNGEFVTTGMLPFEISNKGQRVNVAHKIVIQPIHGIPTISFEYVDHLDMAQCKKLIPKAVSSEPFTSTDMLGELDKAWTARGQMQDEFPFEIKIRYEDVTGTKKFESTVGMAYCPMEEDRARRHALNPPPRPEYKMIKLTGTRIRRLA